MDKETKKCIYYLIGRFSKRWFHNQIGITPPTLDRRLEIDNWKKSEMIVINNLIKEYCNE